MALLRDVNGLIVLLGSAVLFGIFVLGLASLRRSSSHGRPPSSAARIVRETAATAPTDAHMNLTVAARLLRLLARRL